MTESVSGSGRWRQIDALDQGAELRAYLDNAASKTAWLRERCYAAMGVAAGSTVLEAGSGTGIATSELADLVGDAGRVIAFDFSDAMVVATRERVEGRANVEVSQGDIRAIALDDNTVDAARCERVVMHLNPEDAHRAIGELVRVTRPGGRVALIEPSHRQSVIAGAEELMEWVALGIASPTAGLRARAALLDAGCSDVGIEAIPRVYTSIDDMTHVARIDSLADSAVGAGMSRDRADELLAECRRLDAKGQFVISFMTYLVSGTVT